MPPHQRRLGVIVDGIDATEIEARPTVAAIGITTARTIMPTAPA
jgi:hypothetical protein